MHDWTRGNSKCAPYFTCEHHFPLLCCESLYYIMWCSTVKCGAHLEFLLDQDEDLLYKIYVHLTTCMTPVCIMIVYYFRLGFQILNCRHRIESPTSSTYSDSSVDMVQCPGCGYDRHIFDRLNLCSSLARYT